MLLPKEKSVSSIQDFDDKFSKPGELEVILFSGTFAAAKAYLGLSWHRGFVGSEISSDCFAASIEVLDEMHPTQVLKEKPDISCTHEVRTHVR